MTESGSDYLFAKQNFLATRMPSGSSRSFSQIIREILRTRISLEKQQDPEEETTTAKDAREN